MSEQDNLNIVRKEYDGFNSHNLDLTVQYLADTARIMDVSYPDVLSKSQIRKNNMDFLNAFPDLHFDLKDLIAQGDKVAVSWVVHGTHKAPLEMSIGQTIPATNKSIRIPGVTLYELHNGLIAREDIYYDQVTFLTQIGVLSQEALMSNMRK